MSKLIFKTTDACEAVAYVSYAFTEVAAIYPITPSSEISENVHKFSVFGEKNLFNTEVVTIPMQSEAGVAGVMHGALSAGALSTTYTASQGLLLMIPSMYKMAGEFLPGVIHVSARTIATHALSILGDHSDVYACRQTGFAMLCSNNPQESMDFAAISHLSSIKSSIPFLHFFDGFRTSHEIQKIRFIDYKILDKIVDKKAILKFRSRALTPENPILRGSTQNDDIFFQTREASNIYYENVSNIVESYMNKFNEIYKTNYSLFNYYGDKKAENIIIAMGSVCETIEEVVDYLNLQKEKTGLIKVRLLRPFVSKNLIKAIPKTVKNISILDKTKEPGCQGEPLYLDVFSALENLNVNILRGRYGLSSKNTTPSDILSIYENMKSKNPKKEFTISIKDDVTYLSLKPSKKINTTSSSIISCKFWGFGSDGTVSANKNSIKIIGDNTDLEVQGYFTYDSKKSGGLTISHLRFGKEKIKSTYYVENADFIACHNFSYVFKYDMLKDLKQNGKFLLNCELSENELLNKLPDLFKRELFLKKAEFYIINASKISQKLGLEDKISTVLQSAFFKILNFIKIEKAIEYMKNAATKSYIKKGEKIVFKNHKAIEEGAKKIIKIKIPKSWETLKKVKKDEILTKDKNLKNYVENIMNKINSCNAYNLPVSKFLPYKDGSIPQGSSAFEKRSTSTHVPKWIKENCIQCNLCSYVCPHAVIRPALLNEKEINQAPSYMPMKKALGFDKMNFSVVISSKDCTGCSNCVKICPGFKENKALEMISRKNSEKSQIFFDFSLNLSKNPEVYKKINRKTVKGSQFFEPLLEFSGACAGCGETPYAKLVTQLFGENMIIANATGCSSIWAGSSPATSYTKNKNGKGPAWHNSLFENNAEFGYGIAASKDIIRNELKKCAKHILNKTQNKKIQKACSEYIQYADNKNLDLSKISSDNLIKTLKENKIEKTLHKLKSEIINNKNFLSKKSIWLFGGDGWAYDIGFGGLDHVVSLKKDINILIFDTEVYSNTGGQSSKATSEGSSVNFAISGKETKKKDLALMLMNYEHVYIASVAMGANFNQCVKAFDEAESYDGPSIIIAYSPCIVHGIKYGMSMTQLEQKYAVETGYWNLFRFDPRLKNKGKNPFILDSKILTKDYHKFLERETRFSNSLKLFPEKSEKIFENAKKASEEKFRKLKNMSENQ